MSQPLPSYLRTHRRTWALTQRELGELLGISESRVSKIETLTRVPSLDAVLALEVVFGQAAEGLFPALSHAIARRVLTNARTLREQLAGRADKRSRRKRQLLDGLISRLADRYESTR